MSFFLWSFGYGLYNYVWPLYLQDLDASPSQVGFVFSVGFLVIAASMIPGGIVADKYELRRLLIIGWVLSLPSPIIYFFARSWTDVLPGIILLQASGFNIPAFNAYIAGASIKRKTGSSFGLVWAAAPLGAVFSPAVGGVLLSWISIREIFLPAFALFGISTIVLFFMGAQPPEHLEARPYKIELPSSLSDVMLLLILTGIAVAFAAASPFLPIFFRDVRHLSTSTIQGLGSVQAAGQTAFAVVLGRRADFRSRGETIAIGLIVSAAGLAGIVLTGNLLYTLPLLFLFGSSRASSYVAYSVLAMKRHGTTRAGQYGFYLTLESLGFVLGSYLGGVLYAVSEVSGFTAAVGTLLFLALAAMITRFKVRDQSGDIVANNVPARTTKSL